MIDWLEKFKMDKVTGNSITKKTFIENILNPLMNEFANHDDQGQPRSSKLGLFDGYSCDKMISDVKKQVDKFPDNKILKVDDINKVVKILSKYKGKKSPNKKWAINEIINALTASIPEYINNVYGFINMKKDDWEKEITRNIVNYMLVMDNNGDIPDVKKALNRAALVLGERYNSGRDKEVEDQRGVDLIKKYAPEWKLQRQSVKVGIGINNVQRAGIGINNVQRAGIKAALLKGKYNNRKNKS